MWAALVPLINGLLIPLFGWWMRRSGVKEEEAKQFLESVRSMQARNRYSTTQPAEDAAASREKLIAKERIEKKEEPK